MKTPLELEVTITQLGDYVFLEDLEDLTSGNLRVSGVGIMMGCPPRQVSMMLKRLYPKRGKVFFFDNVPAKELSTISHYAFMFATRFGERSASEVRGAKLGLMYFERPCSVACKKPVKPWRIYRGTVCRGKRCRKFKWFILVPTYMHNSVLLICDESDLFYKTEDGGVEYPLQNLILSYNTYALDRLVMSLAIPMFRYGTHRDSTVQV